MPKPHKTIVDKIVSYVLPLIFPVAAALIALLQQIYYPEADVAVVFNIMLLLMSLIEYLPLAINRKDKQPCLLVCNIALLLEAFLYNVFLFGIPSPLENLAGFFDSICGVWVLVACLEICFFIIPMMLARYHGREDGYRSEEGTTSGGNEPGDQDPPPSKQLKKNVAGNEQEDLNKKSRWTAFGIIIFILIFPFFNLDIFESWYSRVEGLTNVVYGETLGSASALLTIILYVVMMFALAILLWILYWVIYYAATQIWNRPTDIGSLLEEYSAPAAVFIVALVVIYAISNTSTNNVFNAATFSEIIEMMIFIIVGIITLLVMFEVLKLVIEQCLKKGTLLKTAMDLVFVLVVQYTTNFITGILKVFAIKDVIESILLFFMPDLNVEIGAKVDRVLNEALEIEIAKLERVLFENNKAELKGKAAGHVQPGMKTTTPIRRRESDEK